MTGALPLLGTTSIGSNLMPLVIVALLIDAFIVAVWYMAGALMNNKTIKASAKGEFYQLIGTIVLAAIIVGVLLLFANMYMNIVGQPGTGLDPPQLNMYCGFLAPPQPDPTSSFTLTSGLLNLGGSLGDNICGSGGILQGVSSSGATATQKIDYPLAATGIIIANLTPFRGASADAGTLVELGWFLGMARPAYGYSNSAEGFATRTRAHRALVPDPMAGLEIEDFGLADNLMIEGALAGGIVLPPDGFSRAFESLEVFERCLASVGSRA